MRQICFLVLIAMLVGFDAQADEAPGWELGLGVATLTIPDYRGATGHRQYLLPLPYIHYRGAVFQIDRSGAHGDLFRSDRIKLDISVNAGPPAKSHQSDARTNMPDIDPTVEAGPSLQIFLGQDPVNDKRWSLLLPLRAAAATDFSHVQRIGWIFSPSLHYVTPNIAKQWDFSASIGPLYATEDYHDYYYEVAPAFATASRPAYNARGGYSGSRLTLTTGRRYSKYWVGAFARYDNLRGAVFEDSPLVKKKDSFMAGIGIAWILTKSHSQ